MFAACYRVKIKVWKFAPRTVFFFRTRPCARLRLQPLRLEETADAWNFGLRATKSREPRQARKGATVPGSLRVPRSTRSSSHLQCAATFCDIAKRTTVFSVTLCIFSVFPVLNF